MIIQGLGNVSAEVIADSINSEGDRLTSLKLHYHRFIHAEFLRHRVFSHSVSSSRAIPIKKMLEQVESNPATPIFWGKDQAGMTANEEIEDIKSSEAAWTLAKRGAVSSAKLMNEIKLHKQITNRVIEPFQFINQVVSGTDFDNFFYLRLDSAAQPEIQELARVMYDAMKFSKPILRTSSLHLPYITEEMKKKYEISQQIMISASMCAQSSYRLADDSLEKAEMIYKKLVDSRPLHASPFEHVAIPFSAEEYSLRKQHKRIFKDSLKQLGFREEYAETKSRIFLYEGNYKGWSQERKAMAEETCYNYDS